MKTKLLFTFLFLTLLAETSFSQAYIPMLNNSSWGITSTNFGGRQDLAIDPGVDAVIGSYTYKKFIDPTVAGNDNFVYLRENISTRKVYRNINGVDRLLYDFSLQVSSNITLSDGNNYIIHSITNKNVNGGTRREFLLVYFSGGFAINTETWIEGVGSTTHPLKPSYELPSDPYINLNCSTQNGVNIYNFGIANGGTSTDCSAFLSVEDIKYLNEEIVYSPNPFNTELLITSKLNLDNSTLKIFNSIGELVKEVNNLNGENIIIKRGNLNSGIYLAQLIKNGKVISTNKIIISD
ncbi:MAG: T9SS type A sorting domain-containing protein [Bacteroidota bacterium]